MVRAPGSATLWAGRSRVGLEGVRVEAGTSKEDLEPAEPTEPTEPTEPAEPAEPAEPTEPPEDPGHNAPTLPVETS